MKLLNVITSIDPAGGGVVEAVRQFGMAQRAAGHHIEVASMDAPGIFDGAKFPLPVTCLGPSVSGFAFSKKFLPWLSERARKFDAVIVNGIWQYPSIGVRAGLRGTGVPFFIFPHGMLDPWFRRAYPLKHLKKMIFWKLFQARTFAEARAILFTCEEEKLLARNSFSPYRCRELVAGLGVTLPPGKPEQQKKLFLEKFPELRGKESILFLGRIHPKKGCDLLLRAFAKMASEQENLRLIMAGPDQAGWMTELKALGESLGVANRIVWPGMLTGDLKWGAFHASAAFALPSHQENFGIAVAEALSCGLPVLISKPVNIWREIEADGAGLVESDSQAGTDQLLHRWRKLTESERATMREKAVRSFRERFEINRAAANMIEVIRGAMSNLARA